MTEEQLIEAMAAAINPGVFSEDNEIAHRAASPLILEYVKCVARKNAMCVLKNQYDAIPGLADVIAGEAVILPIDPDKNMVTSGVEYRMTTAISIENTWPIDTCKLYSAMISASPYRSEP